MTDRSEPMTGPSGTGTVVLELGADIGALVLYTPADLDGREIEISLGGDPAVKRTHSLVRPRHVGSATHYAAVYPYLQAGDYAIWQDAHTQAATATIRGGQVTTCDWPI